MSPFQILETCLATIGVCVFCAPASVGAFFIVNIMYFSLHNICNYQYKKILNANKNLKFNRTVVFKLQRLSDSARYCRTDGNGIYGIFRFSDLTAEKSENI